MSHDHLALTALSPLDGRYRSSLTEVAALFSEFSLIKHRVTVEISYLCFISHQGLIPSMTKKQETQLQQLATGFDEKQAEIVKTFEAQTKHDVKAVEYYLRQKLQELDAPLSPFVHLAMTSEDVNSLSYSLMLKEARENLVLPSLRKVLVQLRDLAHETAAVPMLARTHGQAAVPTTFGKEVINVAMRLVTETQLLGQLPIEAKLTGAVGNFNAQTVAFVTPSGAESWPELSQKFVQLLELQPQLFTTQILPTESYSRFFSSLQRINLILLDLNQDIWRYLSDDYLVQKLEPGQVGSSTMPHKVNPIDFENSEGNLGLANALLQHFITKLPISRLQRDLSDSTVKRSIGSAIGYSELAYLSLSKGLKKLSVNNSKLAQDLDQHWEILAEAVQVVLRLHGDHQGYEKLQKLSQGKRVTKNTIRDFIATLELPQKVKVKLLNLEPATYIGEAVTLTHLGIKHITHYLEGTL